MKKPEKYSLGTYYFLNLNDGTFINFAQIFGQKCLFGHKLVACYSMAASIDYLKLYMKSFNVEIMKIK